MTTWLDRAKRYKSRQDATIQTLEQNAREAVERLHTLRAGIESLCVWALLPIGDEIPAGKVVWYLGKCYIARKDMKKVLTEPPIAGSCWEEWNA